MKFMKKLVALALIAVSLFAIALPAMAATTTKYVKVSQGPGYTVNLRQSASKSSKVLAKPTYGSAIKVTSTSNGWSAVKYYDPELKEEYTGYISSEYLVSTIPSDTKWIKLYGSRDIKESSSKYNDVVTLQTDLNKYFKNQSFDWNPLETDGICGHNTVVAISKFQGQNSLSPDGIAGNRTKEYLYKIIY